MEIEGMSLRDYVSAKYMEYKDMEIDSADNGDMFNSRFFFGKASAMFELRKVLDSSVSSCKPISG